MHISSPRVRTVLQFASHALGAASCLVAAVLVEGSGSWAIPLIGVMLAATAPLGPIVRELIDSEHGAPAPHDLQQLVDQLASQMRTRTIPVIVTVDQPGVAALRGMTRWSRRIVIGEPELLLPTQRLLAILAHELAHAKSRHQLKGTVLSVLAWCAPQVIAGAAVPLCEPVLGAYGVAVGAVVAALLTGGAVLGLYAIMRRQEHEADLLASSLAGTWVANQLVAHFAQELSAHGSSNTRLYATHPAASDRAIRITAT